jgi:hypothetical protein
LLEGKGVGVIVGVEVGEGPGVKVDVAVNVAVGVKVLVGVDVGPGVGVSVGIFVAVGVRLGVGVPGPETFISHIFPSFSVGLLSLSVPRSEIYRLLTPGF